jgi:competence protein ComEC
VPDALPGTDAVACRRGEQWSWDGVEFTILHPDPADGFSGNNASCVLRVAVAGGQSLLLPGDIERAAERLLLQDQGERLAASVLVMPHHGSKTSSSAGFVKAVSPAFALAPAGYMNRYRFPATEVVASYAEKGVRVLRTGHSGAITVKLSPRTAYPQLSRYRDRGQRYWNWQE